MANSKIPNLNLSDTLNTQRLKFNQLLDSVGDVSTLTTTGTDVTSAINEHDAELGTISAGAMGTTASTVSTAIAELDGRLDSINTTELLSPRSTLSDSSATNIVRGNLQVDTNLHVNGNTTNTGSVTIDGLLTSRANVVIGNSAGDQLYVYSSINTDVVPYTDNAFDLGSPTKEWRHVYVDGTVNADNVAADSATIANNVSIGGTLEVTGDTTLSNTITVQDSAYITGNLAVGGNTTMAGTLTVDGQVTFKAGSDNNIALGDAATDTITLTGEVNSNIIPDGNNDYDLGSETKQWRHVYVDGTVNTDNLAADSATIGFLTVTDSATFLNTITVQDSAYITGDLVLGSNLKTPTSFTLGAAATSISIGSYNTGTTTIQHDLIVDSNLTVHGLADLDSTSITGNLIMNTNKFTVDYLGNTVIAGTLDVNDVITLDSAVIANLEVTGPTTLSGTTTLSGATTLENALTVQDSAYITGNTDIGGNLTVGGGFTVSGTFTTTGTTRNAASYVIVNDQVTVSPSNRAGLAIDRPSNDSAVMQWNELGDYWEAGTTTNLRQLARQDDSAAFTNVYAGGTLTVTGNTTLNNPTSVNSTLTVTGDTTLQNALTVQDSAYVTGNFYVGGNFTVNGTTTTVNSTTVEIGDNIILLNDSLAGSGIANPVDAGIEIERGTSTNVQLLWDESEDYWVAANDGSNTLSRIATAAWLDATAPISFNSSTGNISHDDTTRANTSHSESPGYGGSFEVVDSIQSNATGHITRVATRTITLPASDNTNQLTVWYIEDSDGDEKEMDHNKELKILGDYNHINTNFGSGTGTNASPYDLKISHANASGNTSSGSQTLSYGDTFTVYTGIGVDNAGHVDSSRTVQFTLPSSDNTNTTYDLSVPAATTAIRLAGSDATNDDVTITGGTNVTVTRNSATQLTISSTDTNTDTLQSIATNSTNAAQYITFVPNTSGAQTGRVDGGLTYNPSTNTLDVPNITDLTSITGDGTNQLSIQSDGSIQFRAETADTTSRPMEIIIRNTDTDLQDDDELGSISFRGENSTGTLRDYTTISTTVRDVTSPSEDAEISILAYSAGSEETVFKAGGASDTSIKSPAGNILFSTTNATGTVDSSYIGPNTFELRGTEYNASYPYMYPQINIFHPRIGGADDGIIGKMSFQGPDHLLGTSRDEYGRIIVYDTTPLATQEAGQMKLSVAKTGGWMEFIDANGNTGALDIDADSDMTLRAYSNAMIFKSSGAAGGNYLSAGNLLRGDTEVDANHPFFLFQDRERSTSSTPPQIVLRNNDTNIANGESLGKIYFQGDNDDGDVKTYVGIFANAWETTGSNGHDGRIAIAIKNNNAWWNVFEAEEGTSPYVAISSAGNAFIDAGSDIYLDADGGQIIFRDGGTIRGNLDVATSSTIKLYTGTSINSTLNSTWSGDDLTVQGDVNSVSDVRTKQNIETVENGLDLVSQLRGVWYNKIDQEDRKVGVIAQEVEEVLPEVVHTDTEGMKSVDYGKMVGVLIEAIKELKQEIEELKSK